MHYARDHVSDALHVGSRLMLIFRNRPEGEPSRAAQDFISPFLQINLRDELERPRRSRHRRVSIPFMITRVFI
jgi:hypothetical protein